MKMANGGWNPAYNVQYVTDAESRIITFVDVSGIGGDVGLMLPAAKAIEEKYGLLPNEYLVDGGFYKTEDLVEMEVMKVDVYMPVPEKTVKRLASEKLENLGMPLPGDSGVLDRWNQRMETEDGKELYKDRASTAEYANASTRNKGFYQFKTRGLLKAKATAILFAITHNVQRVISIKNKQSLDPLVAT